MEWPFILKGSFTFKLLEAYKIFISTSYSPQRKKMDQKELSSHKARKNENPFPFYPVGGPWKMDLETLPQSFRGVDSR